MKYLWAYSIPLVAILGFNAGGIWNYSALVFTFVFIPILEILLPIDVTNNSEELKNHKNVNKCYDVLLLLNLPLVYGLMIYVLYRISAGHHNGYEIVGMTLSLGIVLGANGINVAHELGHRNTLFERIVGKMLLVPSHYTHFFIEHNHGHHLHVATPADPSTAKYNQTLYAFWWQSVVGTYKKAWELQIKLNKTNNTEAWQFTSDMFWFSIIQPIYLLAIFFAFGFTALLVAIFAGIIGLLLLETINYIEHYGLVRNTLPSGRYERVSEKHSWNSNHVLGRIILYELTRHSDHHYKSQKKYQILEYHDESPQMPFGYPTSMVMAFFPSLWFDVMNKRIPNHIKKDI